MNKSLKKVFKFGAVVASTLIFTTSCNANFCSVNDQAHMLYIFDSGLKYDESNNPIVQDGKIQFANDTVTTAVYSLYLQDNNTKKIGAGFDVPSVNFWVKLDEKTQEVAIEAALNAGKVTKEGDTIVYTDDYKLSDVLFDYGYLRYAGTTLNKKGAEVDTLFANFDKWVDEISDSLDVADKPNSLFITYYKNYLKSQVSSKRSCITYNSGYFGKDGNVYMESKSWKDAWKQGIIAALISYPVALFAEVLANAFASGGVITTGWAALLSIIIVTFVVRGLYILATLKLTMSQQKMQLLQPELTKIQAKYPNANTSQYEKNKLAQEQMALYKKNGVNPMSTFISMFIQFPIFIGVWGALSGCASLSTGSIFGMYLSDSIKDIIFTWSLSSSAWWTAFALFVIMTAAQIISARLPMWMQKKKLKDVTKLGKNPALDQQNKTMKFMQIFLIGMIVVMGFVLPSGMGIYWLISALIQIIQSVVTHNVMKIKRGNN